MRIILVQHLLELGEVSNTGRHAVRVRPSIETYVHGRQAHPLLLPPLGEARLLWPDGPPGDPTEPPKTLVVLDASWSQARRMTQRVATLRTLPRVSVPAPAAHQSLRAAPPGGLSTIEAIAAALRLWEGPDAALPLEQAHHALLEQQRRDRGYAGPMR